MNTDELFINSDKLPDPLPNSRLYELLDKINQDDDEEAIKIVVEHNIRLVLYEVTNKFRIVEYDKKDLVSVGNIGLFKAIKSFDTSKKISFSTYAMKCIDNQILDFLKRIKKNQNVDSLDKTFIRDKEGKELSIAQTISDETNVFDNCEKKETYQSIRKILKELPDRDRQIIMLQFGFYNNKIYTQTEIANMLSISQPRISKLTAKIVKEIGQQLNEKSVAKIKTIYEYFNNYSKEQVDEMLEKLTEDEKLLIVARYGKNLSNPRLKELSREQTYKFYCSLIPKMKKILETENQNNIKTKIIKKTK